MFLPFALLILGVGVMRLVELAVSRQRMRARPDAVVPEGALFPVMALLHASLVGAPLAEVAWLERPFVPAIAGVAAAVLAAATALRIWTLRTIGRSWNVRIVTPEPDGVATGGPYAFIRHPNYLCVILEIAALPMLHGAWLSAIALSAWNLAVLAVRIPAEEAVLRGVPAWEAAFRDRARFLPGVF